MFRFNWFPMNAGIFLGSDSESSLCSQNAPLAPLLTWSSWWMALGVLDVRTSSIYVTSFPPWLVPLTSGRRRQGLLWFSTAQTPGLSSTWTSTPKRANFCGLSTTCLTRVATPWQVHHACTNLPITAEVIKRLTYLLTAGWHYNQKLEVIPWTKHRLRLAVKCRCKFKRVCVSHSAGLVLAFRQTVCFFHCWLRLSLSLWFLPLGRWSGGLARLSAGSPKSTYKGKAWPLALS